MANCWSLQNFFLALAFFGKICGTTPNEMPCKGGEIHCTENVLQQIYPNQNACILQGSIPKNLKHLPFAIYPIQPCQYNTARFNFNKRFNIFPKAIIVPESISSLCEVLKILKCEKLPFSIRSGGHCFEPGSLSPDYILDLRRFDTITLSKDTVYIGVGSRLGPVIEALGKEDRAIPTGTCQSVGIGGLTLGGGLGFLSRTYGLTADALQSITFLTANNKIIEVNEKQHQDLFWALRGGGNGSFGIALGFTFKTVTIPTVSFFELSWDWDSTLIPKIFEAWQKWIVDLDEKINPSLEFRYVDGHIKVLLTGLKVGKEPFIEWIKPFKHLNPVVQIHKGRYVDIASYWADSPTAPFQKIKSLMSFKPISPFVLQKTIDYLEQLQSEQAKFVISLSFVALGGKLTEGDTAYFPRKAFEWWHLVANWNQQEEELSALESLRNFYDFVAPLVSPYCYANDVDYDLKDKYLNAYYGDHVERLIRIKNQYDPKNVFRWRQSIPLHCSLR